MQVNCRKCSQPIGLTDIVGLSDGHLSHVDCQRPQTLTAEERSLVFVYCSAHVVARCVSCDQSVRFNELGCDLFGGRRTNLCPRCRTDLTPNVREHLYGCAMLPNEVRVRARDVREAAQRLMKEFQQLRETTDVLIREAEAHLFEVQRALRAAMARRSST